MPQGIKLPINYRIKVNYRRVVLIKGISIKEVTYITLYLTGLVKYKLPVWDLVEIEYEAMGWQDLQQKIPQISVLKLKVIFYSARISIVPSSPWMSLGIYNFIELHDQYRFLYIRKLKCGFFVGTFELNLAIQYLVYQLELFCFSLRLHRMVGKLKKRLSK